MTKNIQSSRTHQESGHSAAKKIFACPAVHRRCLLVCLLLAVLMIHVNANTIGAQQSQATMINREHKIKAAYIYNFARYIEWPEETFKDLKEPFIIGIVGVDPIRQDLEKLAKSRTIEGRPIKIKLFAKPKDVTPCQILFLSPTLKLEVQRQILKNLAGKNVLFVGQTSNFLRMGGVIDFVVHQNRVRLTVALEAAHREKLKVSAKLLRVAQVVR